jgi:LemA protein
MVSRIIIGVVVAFGLWLFLTYNRLVRLRQYCRESWATIDTELKRRHDLIPNLVAAVRGYAAHEADTLAAVTAARGRTAAGSPREIAVEEGPVVTGMQHLLAVAESYPELKASDNFLRLQGDLADTEDRIQASRRLYNANVRELNANLQSFPANLIARQLGFAEAEFFEIERAVVHAVVDVSFPGPARVERRG